MKKIYDKILTYYLTSNKFADPVKALSTKIVMATL